MLSNSCDVVTGFHVEDRYQHIIVLEGLRSRGINTLWNELPHHNTQGKTIHEKQRVGGGSLASQPLVRLWWREGGVG